MKKKVRGIFYILSVILCIGLLYAGFIFLQKRLNNQIEESISYKPESIVDYKVRYKENDFFNEEFLGEGETYITSLIDYIFVNFNYSVKFDSLVKGSYQYYIRARINAYNNDNKSVWEESYNLTEPKSFDYDKTDNFTILDSVSVDYNVYNERVNEFKKTYGISCTSDLVVELIVMDQSHSDKIDEDIVIADTASFTIPLSQLATEAKAQTSKDKEEKKISKIEYSDDLVYKAYSVCAICCGILAILVAYYAVHTIKRVRDNNLYEYTKKKILNNYDSIIVMVKGKPIFEDLNIINLEDFDSLIDAHSEVRMPINYYENDEKNKSLFVLMNENTAWVYMLDAKRLNKMKGLK